METSIAELVRQVAADHAEIASPRELSPFVLDALRGREEAVLERLLPAYIAALLRRRTPGDSLEWEAFLTERIPSLEGYVFGRNASADDLRRGAQRRRSFAGNLDRRAVQYDAIASAMEREHVTIASQLSEAGQELAALEHKFQLLHQARRRAERQQVSFAVLQKAHDSISDAISRGTNPIMEALYQQRDALVMLKLHLEQQTMTSNATAETLSQIAR